MKSSLIILLGLAGLTFSRLVPETMNTECSNEGPEVYCESEIRANQCKQTEFCKTYFNRPICRRGPQAYCRKKEWATACNKTVDCLTWPDESITAIDLSSTSYESRSISERRKMVQKILDHF